MYLVGFRSPGSLSVDLTKAGASQTEKSSLKQHDARERVYLLGEA